MLVEVQDVLRYTVQDGDILFVNAESVDVSALELWKSAKKFVIVPVYVPHGKTVVDCIAVANKEDHGTTNSGVCV